MAFLELCTLATISEGIFVNTKKYFTEQEMLSTFLLTLEGARTSALRST